MQYMLHDGRPSPTECHAQLAARRPTPAHLLLQSLAKAAASPLDLALQAPSPPTAHPTTSTLRSSSRGLSLLSSSSITGEAGIPPYSPALGCAAAAQAAPAASALAPSPARAAATLRLQATLRAASASSQGLPRTPLGRSGICSKGMALGLKAVSSMSKLGAPGLEALGLRSSDVTRTCDQSEQCAGPCMLEGEGDQGRNADWLWRCGGMELWSPDLSSPLFLLLASHDTHTM